MTTTRRSIGVNGLDRVAVNTRFVSEKNPAANVPPKVHCHGFVTSGLAAVIGRGVRMSFGLDKVADILGQIPALEFTDSDELNAMVTTMKALRRMAQP